MTKDEALKLALDALENHCGNYKLDDAGCERWNKAVAAIKEALAQPPLPVQEPQYEFLIDDLADWKQYVEVDNAPYGLREHVTKVLWAHGIKEKNK
jgi:hypothetical protein